MPGRGASLADGMRITASVRARVLGLQLLRIEADVKVAPTVGSETIVLGGRTREPARAQTRIPGARQNGHGSIGDRLAAANLALEAASNELTTARRLTP